ANTDSAAELALAVHHTVPARPPAGVAPAQVVSEFLPQRAAGLPIQREIDRLVRHAHLRVVRISDLQPTRDLLRRPPQLELRLDHLAEPLTAGQLRPLRPTHPPQRRPVCLSVAIPA